jgi:hypothetical protein
MNRKTDGRNAALAEQIARNEAAMMAAILNLDHAEYTRRALDSYKLKQFLEDSKTADVAPLRQRKPPKWEQIAAKMRADMEQGLRLEDLTKLKQETLAEKYRAARGTCVKALNAVLAAVKMSRNEV